MAGTKTNDLLVSFHDWAALRAVPEMVADALMHVGLRQGRYSLRVLAARGAACRLSDAQLVACAADWLSLLSTCPCVVDEDVLAVLVARHPERARQIADHCVASRARC